MLRALSTSFVVLLLAACATAGSRPFEPSPLLSAGWEPPTGRTCSVFERADSLPAPAELIDARAAGRVLEENAGGNGAAPFAVVEVVFDSLGALHRTRVVESNLPAPAREALTDAVAQRSPLPIDDAVPWGALVRLTATGGTLPKMQVGWTEWCNPILQNNTEIADLLEEAAANIHDPLLSGRQLVVEVEVHADSTGRVVEARFTKRSGYYQVDKVVAAIVPHVRFAPPLLDRIPVDGWMHIPFGFNFP